MKQDEKRMDIAILNGSVVFPAVGVENTNVYLRDGKIAAVTNDVLPAEETVDAAGLHVIPGIFDPHTHLGLHMPFDEDVVTETRAALLGGTTTFGTFFGSPHSHVKSFPAVSEKINAGSYVDIVPHLVIRTDEQIGEISRYAAEFGVTSFKVYMTGVPGIVPNVDDGFILRVLDEVKALGKPGIVCCHTENSFLVEEATARIMREKRDNATLADFSDTHPIDAEVEACFRLSVLAAYKKQPMYIVHLTSKRAVELLETIRSTNPYVSVETTSPYLAITRNHPQGNKLKMVPPMRDQEDCDALWEGLVKGVIDTIGTDNVNTSATEKNIAAANFWDVGPGYAAAQYHLSVCLSEGVAKRKLPIETVVAAMTLNPAKKYGVDKTKGNLLPGYDGDVVLVDLNKRQTVSADTHASSSDFSIYEGRTLTGVPVMTIKNGIIAARDGRLVHDAPLGRCIKR